MLVIAAAAACEVRYPGLSTGTSKWIGAGGQQGKEYMWPIHLNLGIVRPFACCVTSGVGERLQANGRGVGSGWRNSDVNDITWSTIFLFSSKYRRNRYVPPPNLCMRYGADLICVW